MFSVPFPSKEEVKCMKWRGQKQLAETLLPSVIRAFPDLPPEIAASRAMDYAQAIRGLYPPTTDKED